MAFVVKNLPADAGNIREVGSIPGLGKSPGDGCGNSLKYSCLENPMDRQRNLVGCIVHRVTKSQTRLKQLSTCSLACSLFKKNVSLKFS